MTESIPYQDYESALKSFNGAYAQCWRYSASRKRLALRLTISGKKEELYLIATGCLHMNGPFSWALSNLRFTYHHPDATLLPSGLVDNDAGFTLECEGGIAVVKSDGMEIFEDFG